MTSPMYIAEISPARIRGRMVSINQFAIVTGMLLVYFVNYFVGAHGVDLANDNVAALLEESRVGTANDHDSEAPAVKDAMARQAVGQVAKYGVKVDAIAVELERQLTDQGRLIGTPIPDTLSAYVKEADDWTCSEIADNVAAELSRYGIELDVESEETSH